MTYIVYTVYVYRITKDSKDLDKLNVASLRKRISWLIQSQLGMSNFLSDILAPLVYKFRKKLYLL